MFDQLLERVFKESHKEGDSPHMYKVIVLYIHSLYFIFTVQLLTQHEYRSVEMLKVLMKRESLWEEFDLDEKKDGKFIETLITFGKICEVKKEEELLEV